ncbi:metalloprotease, partial [Coprinopsis sp. MPI-PUGE-AT-0042]
MLSGRFLVLFNLSVLLNVVWASPSFHFVKGGHTDSNLHPASGSDKTSSSNSYENFKLVPCGSSVDPKEQAKSEKRFQKARKAAKSNKASPVKFDVHWHVLAANKTKEGGWLSDETIHEQIEVLNDSFDLAEFSWELVNITRTIKKKWFNNDIHDKEDVKLDIMSSLRQGDASTLNVYSGNIDLAGFATFPEWYEDWPELDGVVLSHGTVPGGFITHLNQGFTLAHEVGHWLGLYHTFEGESCDGQGDYVSDTPQQSVASTSCEPSDSCGDLPGGDPFTNYMDYSPDACLSEFSTGQIRRMRDQIRTYRGMED